MAVDDDIVLRVLDNFQDFLDRAVDIGTSTADDNSILASGVLRICADLDGKGLLLANDTVVMLATA